MRKKVMAANWKMYKTPDQTRDFFRDFLPLVSGHDRDEIVVCPPFLDLPAALEAAKGSNVVIGGQNVHWKEEGAFTGETSTLQLLALGVTHVIIGHSERRQYFGETDDTVNLRLKAALEAKLTPICCVGEVLQEREAGLTDDVLRRQCVRAFHAISAKKAAKLVVAYEPVVETRSRRTAFYEALMRIRRTDGRLIPASAVIPIAERLGLVRLIDCRVLQLVLADLAAAPHLNASVNLSPETAGDPDWWAVLNAQVRAHPDIAGRLTLEITETAAVHHIGDASGFVTRAKDLGCRIAIDDFGAGFTSFRNLRRLQVDIVKIDGSFVQNLRRSADDRAFVRSLIELGRALGLKTVAEWVQDEEAAALLAEWGCDYLQGELVGTASTERPWMEAASAHA